MPRQWGLDVLRILSIAAVVVIHTSAQYFYGVDINSFSWESLNFYDSLVRCSVPIFVMISGALFLDPRKNQPIRKILKRNVSKIAIIIVVWGFVYAVLYNPLSDATPQGIYEFLKTWIFGHYHMWFLFMIIGLYLVTPILRCITVNGSVTKYFLILSFILNSAVLFVTSFGHLSAVTTLITKLQFHVPVGFSFYFVLGYWLNQQQVKNNQRKLLWLCFALSTIATFLLTAYSSLLKGAASETFYSYFSLFVCLAASSAFLLGKDIKVKESLQKAVKKLSSASLGVYLIHIMVLDALSSFGIDSLMMSPVFAVPITAAFAIVISFAASLALKSIPFIGKYAI